MRTARFLTVFSILLVLFVASASAQRTRRPTRRPAPKPTPTPVRPIVTAEVTAAKRQVANQLHNVNVFADIFATVAVGIESRDKDAAARRLDKHALDTLDLDKRKIIAALRGLRDGLVALETDFRTKPQLSQYLPRIQVIGALSTQSEDNAIAGRFVAAREPLRQISLKLNETLAVLPGPMPAGTTPVRATTPASTPQNRPVSTAPVQTRPVVTVPQNSSTRARAPSLGMTVNEVLQTSWGAPSNKRKNQSGTTEVWTYSGNRAIYFYNGKVSNIVQ